MRILIVSIFFYPELTGTGKYTGEIAAYLSQHGHQVRAATAPLFYPYWQVQVGYEGWQYRCETWQDMQIFRAPLWVPRKPVGMKRLLHLLSFAISSFPILLGQLRWKPDLVLCVAPTLFSAPAALLVARLSGAKSWLHIQDFELDVALGLQMLPACKVLARLTRVLERLVITGFDQVSTISENMLALAVKKGVQKERTLLLPNWADTRQIHPLEGCNPLRTELNIPDEKQVVLYHGNMGQKQGLQILVETAAQLVGAQNILFLLCGEGAARTELERLATGLPNVRFCGLQPEKKLNELVNLATVHVLPQRASAADLVMPSKLTTMLASGKPVVACAAPGTQLWKVVSQVGVTAKPECSEELASAIVTLINDPVECARLGKLGQEYACLHLEKEVVLGKFKRDLDLLLENSKKRERTLSVLYKRLP